MRSRPRPTLRAPTAKKAARRDRCARVALLCWAAKVRPARRARQRGLRVLGAPRGLARWWSRLARVRVLLDLKAAGSGSVCSSHTHTATLTSSARVEVDAVQDAPAFEVLDGHHAARCSTWRSLSLCWHLRSEPLVSVHHGVALVRTCAAGTASSRSHAPLPLSPSLSATSPTVSLLMEVEDI